MADQDLAGFVERLMLDEIAPLAAPPPGFDVQAYARSLLRRFANPSVRHRTLQIAMDGSQKIPVRWLPALREARRRGLPARTSSPRSPLAALPGGSGRGRPGAAARRPARRTPARGRGARRRRPGGPGPNLLQIDEVFGATCGRTQPADQLTAALTRITQVGVRDALPG
jgi:fructuronate reductase